MIKLRQTPVRIPKRTHLTILFELTRIRIKFIALLGGSLHFRGVPSGRRGWIFLNLGKHQNHAPVVGDIERSLLVALLIHPVNLGGYNSVDDNG